MCGGSREGNYNREGVRALLNGAWYSSTFEFVFVISRILVCNG